MARRYTDTSDDRADKKAGIKEGSARDKALDRQRGVPEPEASRTRKKRKTSRSRK